MNVRRFAKNPRKEKDIRPLQLKIRVVLTQRMTKDQARALLERAVSSGVVPPGIEIRWIDWRKGEHGQANTGRIPEPVHDELRAFYGAIIQGETRFEKVR